MTFFSFQYLNLNSDCNKCGYKYKNFIRRLVMFGASFSIVKLKESMAIDRTGSNTKWKEIFGGVRNDGLH
jgi:hypothetical protein